jgi:hypothetical protein
VIRPELPLIIAEGEFDALLLGQELGELAAVVTLGSTSSTRPEARILRTLLAAPVWYIALDADGSGDDHAAKWTLGRAERVRPPAPHKDWTEAHQAGIDLRRWWVENGFPLTGPYAIEEAAAIQEFDAGLTREAAEGLAGRTELTVDRGKSFFLGKGG